jgi:hypothetical protein
MFILPVSLIPATRGIFVRLPPFPNAWWTVYFLVIFAAAALLFRFLGFSRRVHRSTFWLFLVPILLLGTWQLISLSWNGQDNYLRLYSFLQSVCMCAAIIGAVSVGSGLSFPHRMRIASGLTILIAFVVFVYVGLSFIFPSLRPSHDYMDRTAEGLGFIRIFGPLGKSTTLNFIILPALGYSLGKVFVPSSTRLLWLLLTLFFVGCIVSTGSRGGILCLATFTLLLLLFGRLRAVAILLPFGVVLAVVIAVVGVPERFRSLHDSARVATYETGWNTYSSSVRNIMFGAGHGALYTKLHDDSTRKMLGEDRWYLLDHRTEYGYSLRNSHSAILRSIFETGPAGFALTMLPLLWLGSRPLSRGFRKAKQPNRMLLRSAWAGCVAVIPYFFLEEFFVSAFWILVIWSIFAVCIAECGDETYAESAPG